MCVNFFVLILLEYIAIYMDMEVFSLEEDECPDLFLTQSSVNVQDNNRNNSILGDGMDFQSPCVSLIPAARFDGMASHYEDISDDDFQIPSSQQHGQEHR